MDRTESSGADKGAEAQEDIYRVRLDQEELEIREYQTTDERPDSRDYEDKARERAVIFYQTLHDVNPTLTFDWIEINYQQNDIFSIGLRWRTENGDLYAISSATVTRSIDKAFPDWKTQCKWDAEKFITIVKEQRLVWDY